MMLLTLICTSKNKINTHLLHEQKETTPKVIQLQGKQGVLISSMKNIRHKLYVDQFLWQLIMQLIHQSFSTRSLA